jgi:hypothetical protein
MDELVNVARRSALVTVHRDQKETHMAGMVQASPEQLRQFAKQLTTHSQSVDQIVSQIGSTLQSVQWKDGYKDRLEQDWNGQFRNSLNSLKQNLNDVATSISNRASEYERLQQLSGGGGGGGRMAI